MENNNDAEVLGKGKRHWYAIHTYSGYENKVSANLERKVHSLGMEDKVFHIMIPMENEEIVDDDGKKRIVARKVFPGYVLVEMIVDDRTWYVVRNTPGVTGFVGPDNKNPVPLADEEVDRILSEANRVAEAGGEEEAAAEEAARPVKIHIDLSLQQTVRLKSGPFAGFTGVVSAIDDEHGTVKVLVDMFGRETPVDISYTQVEEID
ncbi:MAG: transcription termination/antitermination factor NusG [Acidaminococcaceae bacterium]|nr:transcription termination/antitermination factor NusG [Acidaminococcaceae bacterium]HCJ90864.1 transcription termination/antitermination factor NusG [Acidaminococcaceae bacterium]